MGVCASSGGMFNNYAIVQGVDHVVPVDVYLPGCPPRPEMLLDAIVKLHDKIQNMKLGVNRERGVRSWSRPGCAASGCRRPGWPPVQPAAQECRRSADGPNEDGSESTRIRAAAGRPSPDEAALAGQQRLTEQVAGPACSAPGRPATPRVTAACRSGAPGDIHPAPVWLVLRRARRQVSGPLEGDGAAFGEAVERVMVDRGELTLHVRRGI